MTDPFTPAPLNAAMLDRAWKSYNHGSASFNAALAAMAAGGVTLAEARGLLDAPQPPSAGYLAVTG